MKDFFGKKIQIGDRCIRYNGKDNNRQYIGIEINKEWYEKAKERF